MNTANGPVGRVTLALGIALLAALAGSPGCVVSGEAYDDGGGGVVVEEPDVFLFGGGFDRRHDAHDFSHRGSESRAAAHHEGRGSEHGGNERGGERGGKR